MKTKLSVLLLLTIVSLMAFGCSQQNPTVTESELQDTGLTGLEALFADKSLTIESATLNFFVLLKNWDQINVHRITEPWDEATVTANSFNDAYAPEIMGSVVSDHYGWHSVDVTALMQSWLNGTYTNYGLLLEQNDPQATKCRIYSREYPVDQPYLEIVYNTAEGPQTVLLPDVADSFVWGFQPDTPHGDMKVLYTGIDDDSELPKKALLYFDTSTLPETAILGDYVWFDVNLDGYQDIDESGIEGVRVNLYNGDSALVDSTYTDADGFYLFEDLMPGDYFIEVDEPADYFFTALDAADDAADSDIDPATGRSVSVTVDFGDKILNMDAGLYQEIKVDCGECDGKVSQLTIRYNGEAPLDLVVYDDRRRQPDRIMFEGPVVNGDEFVLDGTRRHGQMHAEISFWSADIRLAKMHTSCSMPIGPGLVVGYFEVMDGYSRRGGPLCPLDVIPEDCGECDGKVSQLTLRYNGDETNYIKVYDNVKRRANKLMFEGYVSMGDEFTVNGTGRHDEMSGQISIWNEYNRSTRIHTSCSEPIGPGMIYGDYEVVEGYSRHGGLLCPIDFVPEDNDQWCTDGKPAALTLLYTGEDSSYLLHNQEHSKVQCEGDPEFEPQVRIVVTDSETLRHRNRITWFDGEVTLDSTFEVNAALAGKSTLGAKTFVFIYDLDGELLQFIEFHTSCSQPLNENDQFGAIKLVGFTN